jgi:hypothetical protein
MPQDLEDSHVSDYFQSLSDALIDRTIEELIGAVLMALALALALTGLYKLVRRKVNDPGMPMIALMLCANVISMALAASYITQARREFLPKMDRPAMAWRPPSEFRGGPGGPGKRPPGMPVAPGFVSAADADQDGRLSPEEAAEFVRTADAGAKGSIDAHDLDDALRGHFH